MSINASKPEWNREDTRRIWRTSLVTDLPKFYCAQSMIKMKSITKNHLKWCVIFEAKHALSQKIAGALDALGGIAGEW